MFDEFSLVGNSAHLRCQAPKHISKYLDFLQWFKDDKPILAGELARSSATNRLPNRKYLMLPNGELLIRNVSRHDTGTYRCRARHKLSAVSATSKLAGRLIVDESQARVDIRPVGSALGHAQLATIWAHEHSNALLCARVQSFPPPKFTWFKLNTRGERIGPLDDDQFQLIDSCLLIRQVQQQQSGHYQCQASTMPNSSLNLTFRLLVASQALSAQLQLLVVQPNHSNQQPIQQQSARAQTGLYTLPPGSSLYLNCSITGFPYNTIAWFRDGRLLTFASASSPSGLETSLHQDQNVESDWLLSSVSVSAAPRVKFVQATVIQIDNFGLDQRGVYQCQAYTSRLEALDQVNLSSDSLADGERDWLRSASSSIQLEPSLSKPVLVAKFPTVQTLHQGAPLSLECAVSALPPARVLWFLDNYLIAPSELDREETTVEDQLQLDREDDELWRETANPPLISAGGGDAKFQVNQHLTSSAEHVGLPVLVSRLNVSQVSGREMGVYKCVATNSLGSSQHLGQVNVLSNLQRRIYQANNVTLIAGRTAFLQCPIVGYPLGRLDWFHNGQRLPSNHRQRIEPVRAGSGGQLELHKVDKSSDGGLYTCRASMLAASTGRLAASNSSSEISARQQEEDYEAAGQDNAPAGPNTWLEAQVGAIVREAPLIDAQSLPDVLQANEGMRTKLVCSVVQGDHPVEIKWFRRKPSAGGSSSTSHARSTGNLELMQSLPDDSSSPVSLHNFDDSCLLTFKQISQVDGGDYLCYASNQYGRALRWTRVIVNVAPSWSSEPASETSVLLGARLQLDCSAHGFPQPNVVWRRQIGSKDTVSKTVRASDFSELLSSYRQRAHPNGSLVIEQTDLQDVGLYMCQAANGIGGGLSKLVQVRVNVPPYFKQRTGSQLSRLNSKVELKCIVHGDQPMLVGWRKDSEVVDLVHDSRHRVVTERRVAQSTFESTLSIDNLTRQDSGQYVCIGSNEFGSDDLRIQLLVQEPPEAPSSLRLARTTARQATISFRAPYSGNSAIRKYAISYKLADQNLSSSEHQGGAVANSWQQVSLDAPNQLESGLADNLDGQPAVATSSSEENLVSLNLCCLQPFSRYIARLRALNELGQSEFSKSILFTTDEEAIGGPPLDVAVEATGAHSLKVRWRAPVRSLQNGLIRGYYIGYRALASSPGSGQMTASSHQTGFSADGGAQSALGVPSSVGQPSKLLAGLAKQDADAEQYQYKNVQLDFSPLNLRHLGQGASSLGSQVHTDFLFGSDFNLDRQTTANVSKLPPQIHTSYLTNLRRKTAYSVIVQAYNKIGAGPRSDQVVVSTLDAAPPMSPILRVLSCTFNSVQVAWSSRRFSSNQQLEQSLNASNLDHSEQLALLEDDDDPQSFYTIHYRAESQRASSTSGSQSSLSQSSDDEWIQRRIAKRQPMPYTLANLRCGSHHAAFMTATNSLGQSEPGETIKFATMGAAPLAPTSSTDFIQVNLTQVTLRLGAWQNVGCVIGSFLLKYKQTSQTKWTILEHQVHPTVQTVTIAGSAMFSTKAVPTGQHEDVGVLSQSVELNQEQKLSSLQSIGDIVLRNLLAGTSYKLLVEATSEAGSTLVEYEFETANFTSSIISVVVNGISASDWPKVSSGRNRGSRQGGSDLGELDFSYSGGQRATARYPIGAWSLTALFVVASIIMAALTLVLGIRSLLRMKPAGRGGSRDSLISAVLCCSSSSSSSSTCGDSSQSSAAGTCYQISEHPLEAYCSLPPTNGVRGQLAGVDRPSRLSHEGASATLMRPLVSSSSLSTIGGGSAQPSRFHTISRYGTTASSTSRRLSESPSELDEANQSRIRSHYAATLGKQHLSSNCVNGSQPIKFNYTSQAFPARLHEPGQGFFSATSAQTGSSAFRSPRAISSNGTTSGYETSSPSVKLGETVPQPPLLDCNGQPVYLQNMDLYAAASSGLQAECNLFAGNNRAYELDTSQGHCTSSSPSNYNNIPVEEVCKALGYQQQASINNGANQLDNQALHQADVYGVIFGAQQQQQNHHHQQQQNQQQQQLDSYAPQHFG